MNWTPVFRRLTINDVDEILHVEYASFTSPWNRDAFVRELTMNPYAIYIGGELDKKIVAYGGMWIVIDEAHITNIAVLPEYRGLKIGEQLMMKMMETMIVKGVKKATLEVRVSNIVAQNMYQKFGFKNGGIRKSYYTDNYEDALVMWVNLK